MSPRLSCSLASQLLASDLLWLIFMSYGYTAKHGGSVVELNSLILAGFLLSFDATIAISLLLIRLESIRAFPGS